MMINPRKRKTRRRKPRTAAQKAATRKLVARNKRRSPARRRSNPSRRRVSVRGPARRRSYVRKRNPTVRGLLRSTVQPAIIGATGALALDVAWGFLPIPMNLKTGTFRHVVKGAGALALGMVADMVTTKTNADQLAKGAMTVVVHGAMRELTQQFLPTVPLDGLSYYSAGLPVGVGEYVNGMGAYVSSEGAQSPYLAADTLSKPFAGPSAAQTARANCLENESNMGSCYY